MTKRKENEKEMLGLTKKGSEVEYINIEQLAKESLTRESAPIT